MTRLACADATLPTYLAYLANLLNGAACLSPCSLRCYCRSSDCVSALSICRAVDGYPTCLSIGYGCPLPTRKKERDVWGGNGVWG
ncbi:hypothetical protein IWX92DRAFT_364274 [Phyllosticta citricarpa]